MNIHVGFRASGRANDERLYDLTVALPLDVRDFTPDPRRPLPRSRDPRGKTNRPRPTRALAITSACRRATTTRHAAGRCVTLFARYHNLMRRTPRRSFRSRKDTRGYRGYLLRGNAAAPRDKQRRYYQGAPRLRKKVVGTRY